jgi:hypothetical protein
MHRLLVCLCIGVSVVCGQEYVVLQRDIISPNFRVNFGEAKTEDVLNYLESRKNDPITPYLASSLLRERLDRRDISYRQSIRLLVLRTQFVSYQEQCREIAFRFGMSVPRTVSAKEFKSVLRETSFVLNHRKECIIDEYLAARDGMDRPIDIPEDFFLPKTRSEMDNVAKLDDVIRRSFALSDNRSAEKNVMEGTSVTSAAPAAQAVVNSSLSCYDEMMLATNGLYYTRAKITRGELPPGVSVLSYENMNSDSFKPIFWYEFLSEKKWKASDLFILYGTGFADQRKFFFNKNKDKLLLLAEKELDISLVYAIEWYADYYDEKRGGGYFEYDFLSQLNVIKFKSLKSNDWDSAIASLFRLAKIIDIYKFNGSAAIGDIKIELARLGVEWDEVLDHLVQAYVSKRPSRPFGVKWNPNGWFK